MAINDPLDTVPNTDSRRMQPLPWIPCLRDDDACFDVKSDHTNKHIMTFWGGDTRHPQDLQWPTAVQRERHAKYALHCVNMFPHVLEEIERIYFMEGMPEEAIKAIEEMMEYINLPKEDMPAYAK